MFSLSGLSFVILIAESIQNIQNIQEVQIIQIIQIIQLFQRFKLFKRFKRLKPFIIKNQPNSKNILPNSFQSQFLKRRCLDLTL
jgi:hypothetical protein